MTDDEALNIIYDKLGYCGCADKDPLLLIRKVLEFADRKAQKEWHTFDKFVNDVCHSDENVAYCLLFLCENAELMEHGTSIRGVWLTEIGYQFLDFIKNGGIEKLEKGEQI